MKYIGVLGLQGGVEEHHYHLAQLPEVKCVDIKYANQLNQIDGLIIPGGESTTLGRLLQNFGILEPLKQRIIEGLPVWGTCAGMILLAKEIEQNTNKYLVVMDITVRRNAYGRQLGSFETQQYINAIGKTIPLIFIRAPLVSKVGGQVEVLAEVKGEIVACRERNMLATSFHPELTTDISFHDYFIRTLC